MSSHIVSLLIEERARLQAAIDALKGAPEPGVPDWAQISHSDRMKTAAAVTPKKRILSPEGRQRIIEATKARWAARRAAVLESVEPKRKTNSVRIAEAIAPPEDAEFKARMSAVMKKAWAKRKKARLRRQEVSQVSNSKSVAGVPREHEINLQRIYIDCS